MDKYLTIMMIFMFVGIPISFINWDGTFREPPWYGLFWASIIGIIVIMFYGSYQDKKRRQKAKTDRRSKK